MEEKQVFEDLYDIERRPGSGVGLWTKAVERQLARVREVNHRHRLHHSLNEEEKREDPTAEPELHADVYFLCLAVRRVLLFHDALAAKVDDARLGQARREFDEAAPNAKLFRDFYEHLDMYLLDDPRKHRPIPGRTAPVLHSRWDCDNVVVSFGGLRMDVTLAAVAAIELGKTSETVWEEHLARNRVSEVPGEYPDDGVTRMLEVKLGVSTVIGGEDEHAQVNTGTLLGVRVREATPDEVMGDRTGGS